MVELHEERNLVSVLSAHCAANAKRGGNRVAATLDRQLDDVLGIKVGRILREACACAVLDSLVNGKNAEVSGSGKSARVEHLVQGAENSGISVGVNPHAVYKVRSRKVEFGLVDGFAGVVEKKVGLVAEVRANVSH